MPLSARPINSSPPDSAGRNRNGSIQDGPYRDSETGTHYNYFRDYDPAIGRYTQSDPIGLKGGLNTYAYVRNFPVGDSDAEGLQGILPGPIPVPIPGPIFPIPPRPGDPITGIPTPPAPSPIERFWRWLCRDDDDPECEKFRERDEVRCSLVARPRYGKKGFKLCMDSAAV